MNAFTLFRFESDDIIRIEQITDKSATRKPFEAARIEKSQDGSYKLLLPSGLRITKNVYLDLPRSFLRLRVLEMPLVDPDKIRKILPVKAEGLFRKPLQDLCLDYIVLPEQEGKKKILLCAMEKSKIIKLINAFKAEGFEPRVIASTDLISQCRRQLVSLEEFIVPPELDENERLGIVRKELRRPSLNFRRGSLKYIAHHKEAAKLLRSTVPLMVILIALLVANWGVRYQYMEKRINRYKDSEAEIFKQVFPAGSKLVDPSYQIKAKIQEIKGNLAILSGTDSLDVLEVLADAKGAIDNLILDEIKITEDSVVVKGSGPSFETMNFMAEKLRFYYSEVKIADSKTSVEGNVRFSLVLSGKRSNL